jgi:hypothetical protein
MINKDEHSLMSSIMSRPTGSPSKLSSIRASIGLNELINEELNTIKYVDETPVVKTMGYYTQPIQMKVAPLRSSILSDI